MLYNILYFKKYDIFLIRRNLKDFELQKYQNSLNNIPTHIVEEFKNRKGLIYIDKQINKNPKVRGSAKATHNWQVLKIKLNHGEYLTLDHEFGHILDFINDCPSSTDEFKEIYLKERAIAYKELNYRDYHLSDTSEYFAESFKRILQHGNAVKNAIPETYYFIMKYIKTEP